MRNYFGKYLNTSTQKNLKPLKDFRLRLDSQLHQIAEQRDEQ